MKFGKSIQITMNYVLKNSIIGTCLIVSNETSIKDSNTKY